MNMKKIATAGVMGSGLLGIAVAGIASAATVGAGNSILVQSKDGAMGQCTINSVGTANGKKAAITAGHCGKEGDKVYLNTQNGPEYIGTITHSKQDDQNNMTGNDYAIIEIDDKHELTSTSSSNNALSMLVPIPNAPAYQLTGAHDDAVQPGTIIIKDGSTLGRVVGVTIGSNGDSTYHIVPVAPGDSGGNVYTTDGKLVGVTSRGMPPFFLITQNNSAVEKDYESEGNTWEYHKDEGVEPKPHEPQSWGGKNIPAIPEVPSSPEVNSAVSQVSNEAQSAANNIRSQVPMTPATPAEAVNTVSHQSHIVVNEAASQVNGATNNMFTSEVGQVSGIAHDAIGQASGTAHDVLGQVNGVMGGF